MGNRTKIIAADDLAAIRHTLERVEGILRDCIRMDLSPRAWARIEFHEDARVTASPNVDPFVDGPVWQTERGEQHPLLPFVREALSRCSRATDGP